MHLRMFMRVQPDSRYLFLLPNGDKIIVDNMAIYESVWLGTRFDSYEVLSYEYIIDNGVKTLKIHIESKKMSKGNKYNITCYKCGKQLDTDDTEILFDGYESLWLYCEPCKLSANVFGKRGEIRLVEWSRWEE